MKLENFGKNLKKYRLAAGISQRVLADFGGCNSSLISLYERGERYPTLYTAIKLAKILRVTLNDLTM